MKSDISPLLHAPEPLALGILFLGFASLLAFFFGRRIPTLASVPVLIASVGLLVLLGWLGYDLSLEDQSSFDWISGWILPRRQGLAIRFGMSVDVLGVSSGIAAATLAVLLQVYVWARQRWTGVGRFASAIGFSLMGSVLAWSGITPWASFLGMVFAALGGVIALGGHWRDPEGAEFMMSFGIERISAIMLAVLGAGAITHIQSLTPAVAAKGLGPILLLAGIFVFAQPFPLLGRLTRHAPSGPVTRIYIAQAAPLWVSLGALIRNESLIRAAGLGTALGWIGSLAAILAATSSFFQNNWMNAASLWLSAIGMVSFAALGFVGPHVAIPICLTAVTVSLGWAILADGAAKKVDGAPEGSAKGTKNKSNWLLSVALFGAFSSAGGLLFASAGGFVALYAEAMEQSPARAAVVLLCSFLVSACGARVAWQLGTAFKHESEKSFIQGRWLSLPVLVIFVGFGVFWNGTLTGLDASIFSDRVLGSVLERISPNSRGDSVNTLVIGVHFALLLTSILIAWWNGASGAGPFRKFVAYAPRLSAFVSGGYGTERAFAGLADAFRFVGRHLQTWIDEKFSNTWAPYVLNRGVQSAGRAFGKGDRALSNLIARVAYALSTAATGAVQSAHTGNLQWYVTFAIGAGISLLIHFLVSQQ